MRKALRPLGHERQKICARLRPFMDDPEALPRLGAILGSVELSHARLRAFAAAE